MSDKMNINNKKAAAYWTAYKTQQSWYEICSDWNEYDLDEQQYIKNYIGSALYGCPDIIKESVESTSNNDVYEYNKECTAVIESIFNKIIDHGIQLSQNRNMKTKVLFNTLLITFYYDESLLKCDALNLDKVIYSKPLFTVKKNVRKMDNTIEYLNWYIDSSARVYESWQDFLSNNNLPKCTMIVPKDGIYQANLKESWSEENSSVWVEIYENNVLQMLTNAVDVASTIINVSCVSLGVVSLFNPVTTPIVITGIGVGSVISSVWSGSRSIHALVDRSKHHQSIADKDAILPWINAVGSALSVSATGGFHLLSRAIRTGTSISKGAQITHDAVQISNLCVNGIGIGYNSVNVIHKYVDKKEVSTTEVLTLTAHIFLVCNAAINMKLTSEIIQSSQNQIIENYENNLRSKRHRKEFRRLVRKTEKVTTDNVKCKEQIIRSFSKIDNKSKLFSTMVKNNKSSTKLNKQLQVNEIEKINPSLWVSSLKITATVLPNLLQNFDLPETIIRDAMAILTNFMKSHPNLQCNSNLDICSKLKSIIYDLQEYGNWVILLKQLLDIVASIIEKMEDYTEKDLPINFANFVWSIVKDYLRKNYSWFSKVEIMCDNLISKILEKLSNCIKKNFEEWISAYYKYKEKIIKCNEKINLNVSEKSLDCTIKKLLEITGSKMMKTDIILSKTMERLCREELDDLFMKYSIELNFNLNDLINDLKCILIDLEIFDQRDIIFYKLVVISINDMQISAESNQKLKKDRLVKIMKCIWLRVNVCFNLRYPSTIMMNDENNSIVINIIVQMFNDQASGQQLSSAYDKYLI